MAVELMAPVAPTGTVAVPRSAAGPGGRACPVEWLLSRPRPVALAGCCVVLSALAGAFAPKDPLDAVGLLVVAAVVFAVLAVPLVGAVLLVGLVPVCSGLAPGFPLPHVRLSEAVIGLVGVTVLASVRRRHVVPWQALDWALLAYGVGWAVFGVWAATSLGEHLQLADWGTVFGQLQFFLAYRAVRVSARTAGQRRLCVRVVLMASLAVSILAIGQQLRVPSVGGLITSLTGGVATAGATSGASAPRATGPFDNWAALAGYLLPILLVLAALGLSRLDHDHRRGLAIAGLAGAIALVLTVEQSAIVCLVAGLVLLLRRYGRGRPIMRWAVAALVVAGLALGPLLVGRVVGELAASAGTGRISWVPQTLSFRWSVWTGQYFPAIGARPLSGYGVVLPTSIAWPYPESQYVSFLIEGGLPMLALFGALAWATVGGARRAVASADPWEEAVGRAALVAVVAMLVMDVVWPFLSNGGLPQVLWVLLALVVPRGGSPATEPMPAGPAVVR